MEDSKLPSFEPIRYSWQPHCTFLFRLPGMALASLRNPKHTPYGTLFWTPHPALPLLHFPRRRKDSTWGNGGRFRTRLHSSLLTFIDLPLGRVDINGLGVIPSLQVHLQFTQVTCYSYNRKCLLMPPVWHTSPTHPAVMDRRSVIYWLNSSWIPPPSALPPLPTTSVGIMVKSRLFEDMCIPSYLGLGRNLFRRKLHFFYSAHLLLSMRTGQSLLF